MALMHDEFHSLDDLFVQQLEDLYDAENRLTDALPKMADAATSDDLAAAFREHLEETKGHVQRLKTVFDHLNREPERETCAAMKGLIKEGSDMIEAKGDPAVRDAALIAAAQRVEHYEMAGYGTVRTFAELLGHGEIVQLLQQTLDEEGHADKKLTQLAKSKIDTHARAAAAASS